MSPLKGMHLKSVALAGSTKLFAQTFLGHSLVDAFKTETEDQK
jgi:hypothetical protein